VSVWYQYLTSFFQTSAVSAAEAATTASRGTRIATGNHDLVLSQGIGPKINSLTNIFEKGFVSWKTCGPVITQATASPAKLKAEKAN